MKKLITILMLIFCFSLTGCYVPSVQQGNVLKPAQINQLQQGMNKQDVLSLLGEPILVDIFNADLWTYAYTKQIHGKKIIRKDLILHFQNNQLVKIEKNLKPQVIPKKLQK